MHSASLLSLAVTTLLSMAGSAQASPIDKRLSTLTARDFNCDVKNVQCCESTMSHSAAKKEFVGLLGLDDLVGNLGLNCSPIGISAISSCKSTPVCCSQVSQSGLINAGCSPLSIA